METQAATLPRVFSFGFWKILCKGTGQVMFQDNAWTGLFFLAGIFYGSYVTGNPAVAWGALAGVFMSTYRLSLFVERNCLPLRKLHCF